MEDIGMMKTETLIEKLEAMRRDIDAVEHRGIKLQKTKDEIRKLENKLEDLKQELEQELKQNNVS